MQERVQLARALAEKHERRLTEVEDWRPLLEFTQGNPLTTTVLVGQALHDGLKKKDQIDSFISQLRAGEAVFQDEVSLGRSASLGASLNYGFEHAFTEEERKKLALLYFFQGVVSVNTLRAMGHPESNWCLPEVRGLSREDGMKLLDRASEIGLLTAYGGGLYLIHPVLPWFFKSMLDRYYSPSRQETAARAFVETMSSLGNFYFDEYRDGKREVIAIFAAEEKNLLYARQLARKHGWWYHVISSMRGLIWLYYQTGRMAEWERLVNEILPDFIDLKTNFPLPGREEEWTFITQFRVLLARQARKWREAEDLQRFKVEWYRKKAAPALAVPEDKLDDDQRLIIDNLGISLNNLADIQRELGNKECASTYKEALSLAERIGKRSRAAEYAYNLGIAYMEIPALRDLAEAERWLLRSLKLFDEHDMLGQSKPLGGLGHVAWERFKEARAAEKPEEEQFGHLNTALYFYQKALGMIPSNAVDDLAIIHHQLGIIYYEGGYIDSALSHYREAIRYRVIHGDLYGAAQTRFAIALALVPVHKFEDALEYANEALRNFETIETFDDRAAEDVKKMREMIGELIAGIEQMRIREG